MAKTVKAYWSFLLDVECPKCEETFDHTLVDDWHMGWGCERIEVGKSGDKFGTCCPSCGHEFDCETVY